MKKTWIISTAVLLITAALSGCTSPSVGKQTPGKDIPLVPPVTVSTLDGGVVAGNGLTIREYVEAPENLPWEERSLWLADNQLLFEYGTSGSEACKGNFTAIALEDTTVHLTYRVGMGSEDMVCTDDYKITWYLLESDGPLSIEQLSLTGNWTPEPVIYRIQQKSL